MKTTFVGYDENNLPCFETVEDKKDDLLEEVVEIRREQTNPFYSKETCHNGGGYDQPSIEFEFNGIAGNLEDDSCGDYGSSYDIEWDHQYFHYDDIENEVEVDNTFTDTDFIKAFNKAYPNTPITPQPAVKPAKEKK